MSKPKILTVDDDPDTLCYLKTVLEGEYETIQASTGQECLSKARAELPDLLVLDCDLPDIKGPEICAILRKDPLFLNVPILMLTGKAEIKDKVTGLDSGVDDYMVKPFDPVELVARVRMLLRRSGTNLDANPLTRIPGNVSIQRELEDRIDKKEGFAVLYVDIDNFKALNDHYGFQRGDRIIKETSRILMHSTRERGTAQDFVGHIGGDDFVIITMPRNAEDIANKIISDFDTAAPGFFDDEDKARGYIETKSRDGETRTFGFITISISMVTTDNRDFSHVAEIGTLGAELKKLAKKCAGSTCVIDRRE